MQGMMGVHCGQAKSANLKTEFSETQKWKVLEMLFS